MKRIIAILLLACSTVNAQVWLGGTNEKSGVTSPLLYTNFLAGQFRVTVGALDGGSPIDLSSDRVSLQVEDTRDGKLVVSNTCIRLDAYTYRGEGSLSASPAPYTLKVVVYPEANPSAFYPIYWASLTITSAPSAGAGVTVVVSNQHMASLRSDSAPTGRVAVSRADGGVDLLPWGGGSTSTGITVESDPIYSASPWASTSPTAIIAAASSGGGFTVSNNADGKVGYQTGSDFVTWEGATIATGTTLHLTFESADDLTNFYLLNWGVYTAEVVRGRLVVSASAESVDQTRAMAISNPAPSTACFVTAKMIGSGAVGSSANQQYGIGMGVSATNTWRMLRLRQAAGFRHFRGYDNNLTAAGSFATGGTGTFPADPNLTLEAATIEQFPFWVGSDHDGVLTLRWFIAKDNGFGLPGRWLQIGSKTNAAPGSYLGMVFSSPAFSQGAPSWILDDFTFTSGSLLQ